MQKKDIFSIIFFLTVMTTLGIVISKYDISDTSHYKLECKKHKEFACEKYMFLSAWDNVIKELYPVNVDLDKWDYWKKRYLNQIKSQEDAYVAIDSMLAALDDPYTRFLDPEEVKDQNMNIAAELSGIGVVIGSINGKITVEEVIENSPAQKAGMKVLDIILKANDTSVSGLDIKKVADILRGKEGTQVNVEILRNHKIIKKTLTRAKISIKAIHYKMLKDNIAYININTFMSKSTSVEFINALKNTSSAKGIIIDLRGNSGGLLQNATFIANTLLEKGKIVSIVSKDSEVETINVKHVHVINKKPIVVLVNGLSASAAEILAAALKENNRAVLVGETTYGKGLIQKITPLPMDTAMNITIAKYLTPDGNDINKNGIKPNYEVKVTKDNYKDDIQLQKAIELINK